MTPGTEKYFGYEWNIYREIIPLHERQFEGWISPLQLDFFKGKSVLDAGCGIGRNSLWALRAGASKVLAFDYDQRTVSVARENLKAFQNCEVSYSSIYDIAHDGEFDVAMCIGVLHHLHRPKEAVAKIVRSLARGGTLIFWVYAREGNERYLSFFDPLRKHVTSRIPHEATRMISKALTAMLKVYLMFPHDKPYLGELKARSFRHMEAMVFDQLLPTIAHYWTRDGVLSLIEGLPVDVVHLTHTHGMSWTLVARKR
jgi:SAM-dependent methyltransferase